MMRQLGGMMETEGRSSAYRIASAVLTEAAMINAATGLAAARVMAAPAMLSWDGIVNALLLGIVRRRPDLAGACVVTWSSLALPYYTEPHYRQEKLGEFILAGIAAATESDVATLVDILRAAIEAESHVRTRATLLERLTDAAGQREFASALLDEALVRWRMEAPIERDGSTPSRYDDVISLDTLEERFHNEDKDEPNYEGLAAYARLVTTADMEEAYGVFQRWPAIQRDTRARFALVDRALSNGQAELARSLIDGYREQPDERATWNHWIGGGTLKYFQARLKLDGGVVHDVAFSDLVGELAAGRENALSILLDLENIFPTIATSPDWPAMWECLAEQLRTTREHDLGELFEVPGGPNTDDDLIITLYRWALSLSLFELSRHVRIGALRLRSIESGRIIFTALARRLLEGEADEPAEGLRLLSSDATDMSATVLKDAVAAFVDHPDYAVAIAAVQLSERWGQAVSVSHVELPAFYRLHLDESGDDFDRPSLADPTSGAMRVEDPLGWTFAFAHVIMPLAKKGVSVEHIRYRCRMFIEQWGGLAVFGQLATDKLEAELRRLDMRSTYSRPHIVVGARAIRYVAGEMLRAGLIGEQDHPWLLHMMGYPAVRLPVLLPAERPRFVERPSVDQTSWTEKDQRWLAEVDDDVRPLITERNTVFAEITRFRCRDIRNNFTLERMRAPFFDICQGEDLSAWSQELPGAVWTGNIMALSNEPASTIVRRFSESQMPEMSIDMLVICPHWLRHLGWRRHPENWLIYFDRAGRLVANVVWWRDGGPIDVGEDVLWGEGILVTITPEGRTQIEQAIGRIDVHVHARRTATGETGRSEVAERHATARD